MIVRAQTLDIAGRESPSELDANPRLLATIESLRRIAGERMGLGDVSTSVVPKPVLVSAGDDPESITSRYFTPHRCHSSHAVTGAIGVATAFALQGTVASGCARTPGSHMLSVLHPEGRIEVEIELRETRECMQVERAALVRTARRIMHGELTLPEYVFPGAADAEKRAITAASRQSTLHRLDIIVPTNPGGANDAIARLMAREFEARGYTEVQVDNRAGANGTIACQHARRATPDGSTLLLGYTATHGIHPAWEDVGYDPTEDFAPVGVVCVSPTVLVVSSRSQLDSVAALIDVLHRPSQRLRYAASGRGTLTHLAAELLGHLTGCALQPQFFPGSAPALADVLRGGADFMVASLHTALPYLRSGALRALSLSSDADYAELAGVPSFQEVGLTGLDIAQWYGLFAPRPTPHPIVEKLNAELAAIVRRAEIAEQMRAEGAIPVGGTADELAQLLVLESERWRQVIGALRTPPLSESID